MKKPKKSKTYGRYYQKARAEIARIDKWARKSDFVKSTPERRRATFVRDFAAAVKSGDLAWVERVIARKVKADIAVGVKKPAESGASVSSEQMKMAAAVAPRKVAVVVQDWLESEAGWGQRPDGVSFHLSSVDRAAYCKAHWADMPPRDAQGRPPAEYSRECGDPYVLEIAEGSMIHQLLLGAQREGRHGVREYNRDVISQLKKGDVV